LQDPVRATIFSFASAMHAVGHAALALAAGGCAQALAGGPSLLDVRSTLASQDGAGSAAAFRLALLGLVAVVVKVCGGTLASYAQARIGGDVGGALRLEVLDGWLARHRLRHPRQGDHGEPPATAPAAGVAALTSHVRDLEVGLQVGALGGLRAIAQLIPLMAVLVWLAPKLALAAACVFVPFSAALSLGRKTWKRANARAARHREELLEAADEAVRHAELWTTYGAEARVRTHVAAIGRALANHAARLEASASALSGANEVLGAAALVCALGAARAGWIAPSAAGSGAILPFAVTFFLAYKPLRDLTDARMALARAGAALDALAAFLDAARAPDAFRAPPAGDPESGRGP
jgi:ABC-type multidrug transport system fused ATPase/permease subunit